MSLKSVNQILAILQLDTKFQEQPLQQLLTFWSEVVGAKVAAQTQPLSIQRDVLWVATSSAVWAQNLTFKRKNILLKLNQKLPQQLIDIRFSTAQWKQTPLPVNRAETLSPQEHPSYLGEQVDQPVDKHNTEDVKLAFAEWVQTQQGRSQNLPLCPQCQCYTPPGELQRWGVCSPCWASTASRKSKV
jgi:predicted nucleic acid-binding Zn ribbon protein